MKKWLTAAMVCILMIGGCGAYILYERYTSAQKPTPAYVINQVRLKVSEIMFALEQNHATLSHSKVQQQLLSMSRSSGVSLVYAQLDGTVLFSSTADLTSQRLDLKNTLHYDLYTSRITPESVEIAFPVVDERSKAQVGNAIFTLPAGDLEKKQSSLPVLLPFLMMMLSLVVLALLLYLLGSRIKSRVIRPVAGLKVYAEAILKGNYGQKAEHGSSDEIGEVYMMFDQMRMEIMELSERRNAQEQAQKELISNISHDLKTPLTTLKAYIEAIRDGVCSDLPSVMAYMEIMQSSTDKMTRLVDDLLLHALRDLGQISVEPKECYSRELFRQILKPISHYVGTTGVTFIEPQAIPNVLIRADHVRLEQVLSNLVANALKATAAGDSIRVSIEQEQQVLKVTIADTGEGMLPKDMPFIFERYFKGHSPSRHEQQLKEGTGLGLSICKHIIEAHQGTISFKSIKGQGTLFYFTLPLC